MYEVFYQSTTRGNDSLHVYVCQEFDALPIPLPDASASRQPCRHLFLLCREGSGHIIDGGIALSPTTTERGAHFLRNDASPSDYEMWGWFLFGKCRNKGLGTLLLQLAQKIADQHPIWCVVNSNNLQALSILEENGFSIHGSQQNFIVMRTHAPNTFSRLYVEQMHHAVEVQRERIFSHTPSPLLEWTRYTPTPPQQES